MASFLATLLRRKGPSDEEGRTPREPPAPLSQPQPSTSQPVLPPTPTPIRAKDDNPGDLTITRRQSSQVNLNRFFASAPVGLHAILKAPSRPDIETPFALAPASSATQPPIPSPLSPFHTVQLPTGAPAATASESPLVRPARERRRSMTVSEIAANMQNIDVSQAALIMMPTRIRQELGQDVPAQPGGGGIPTSTADKEPSNSAHLPHLSKTVPNSAATCCEPGSPNAATAVPSGPKDARIMDRKPSIIREAVRHQQRSMPFESGPSVPGQRSPGASMIASPGTCNTGSMDPSAQGPLVSRAAGLAPADRRVGTVLVPTMQLQQHHLTTHNSAFISRSSGGGGVAGAAGGGGALSSRASMSYGGSTAQTLITCPASPSPQPPVVPGTRAGVRQSDPGEPFRSRAAMSLGLTLEAMLADARPSSSFVNGPRRNPMIANHNHAGGGDGGATGGGGSDAASSEPVDDEMLQFMSSGVVAGSGGSADIKLPSITSVSPAGGSGRRGGGSTESREMGGGVGKGGLTAADVAALAEAMNAAQNEAARLRASALRNIEGRQLRTFMDADLGSGSRASAMGPQSNENGGGTTGGSSPMATRIQVGPGARAAHRPPQLLVSTGSPGRLSRLLDSPRPGAASGSGRFGTPTRNKSSASQDVDGEDAGTADVSPSHAGAYGALAAPSRGSGADVPNARRRS